MKRIILVGLVLFALLVTVLVVSGGCRQKTVTVMSGEVVLCTEGELVSDTTESIDVPANEVGDYAVKTSVITCDLHSKIAALYDEAQGLLGAGDLDGAERLLAEVVGLDSQYRRAASQLGDLKAGKTPIADGAGTNPVNPADGSVVPDNPKPGDETPTGPILNLTRYVPDTLPGYVGQGLIADVFVLTRTYLPTRQGAVASMVIVVEQFQNAAAAQAELDKVIRQSYPDTGAAVDISGASGYAGASRSVAAVGFVNGALLVVIEASPTSGSPSELKNAVIELARGIAD